MTPIALDKSRGRLIISTPIGTKGVRSTGEEIIGYWGSTSEFTGLRRGLLLEEFLNTKADVASVLSFTKRYAPLWWELEKGVPADVLPSEDREFRFYVEAWYSTQQHFQHVWRALGGRKSVNTGFRGYFSTADGIDLQSGRLVFRASNLRLFMVLEFLAAPIERFRFCRKPECHSPYFIAQHLRQNYCSSVCAEWGQSEAKKRWWAESGPSWRALRSDKRRTSA